METLLIMYNPKSIPFYTRECPQRLTGTWRRPTPCTSRFQCASRAGDTALDLGGVALRAESTGALH